ncbi:MAG: DMT family transporter [Burkholderiaceae bacterium]
MSPSSRLRLAKLLLFVAPALWSANYIVARSAPGVIEPHLLAFLRWLFAFGLMLPFARNDLKRNWPAWRSEWRDFLVLGGLGMWICGAFVYLGGQTTQALNIGLIYALTPVLIAVASAFLFADKLRGWQIAGLAMAVSGVVVIVTRGSWVNFLQIQFTSGDLWILTAAASWTVYSLLLRRQPSVLGPFARLTMITAGGLIVLIPFTVAEVAVTGLPQHWGAALSLALLAAVLPGFGAYQAYSFMQRELGAARTGLVLYLSPLYTAIVAWIVLSETPQWFHAAGALLILPGMYLATRVSAEKSSKPAKATEPTRQS